MASSSPTPGLAVPACQPHTRLEWVPVPTPPPHHTLALFKNRMQSVSESSACPFVVLCGVLPRQAPHVQTRVPFWGVTDVASPGGGALWGRWMRGGCGWRGHSPLPASRPDSEGWAGDDRWEARVRAVIHGAACTAKMDGQGWLPLPPSLSLPHAHTS